MDRFVGRYEHSLDTKGRLVLPARLRQGLDSSGGYLAKGPEGCVDLWPAERFQQRLAELEEQAAGATEVAGRRARVKERVFAAAEHVAPDTQGRIPIAPYLVDFAGLDPARVLVHGANKTIQLWNPERWARLEAEAELELLGDEHELVGDAQAAS